MAKNGTTTTVTFQAILEQKGATATGIVVPPEVVESLGSGKRPKVKVTIRDFTYPSTVAVMGGQFLIPVSADVRKNARVSANDSLEITLELDFDERVIDVPPDLSAALASEPGAEAFFNTLSYSNKRRIVLAINDAKTPETRIRRIEKSIANLLEGRI